MTQVRVLVLRLGGHWTGVQRWIRRRLAWAVAMALAISLLPWTPPSLTPAIYRAMSAAPHSTEWIAPLALSISGWADRAMASLGSAPVHAGDLITLTLSKRDDGASLTPLLPVGPDPLVPGSSLIYYVEVTNSGLVTATVHVTETLPEGLTCGDAWRVPGYDGGADWYLASCSGRQVHWYTLDAINDTFFDGLGPGRRAVLYVVANVQWPLEDGHVFDNTPAIYTAWAAQEPQYLYTGTSDVTTTVRAPRLAIAKTAFPLQAWVGEEITYTLAVSNSGQYALTAPFTLTVVDPLPAGSSLVRYTAFPGTTSVVASASGITWTVPFTSGGNADLAPGETLTATLVVAASSPFTHGSYMRNTGYSVSVTPSDLVVPAFVSGQDVSVQVQSRPSLTIAKAGPAEPVYVHEDWTYWITVTNASEAMGNAAGLVITDAVPANAVLQSAALGLAESVQYDCVVAGCVITWAFPSTYSLSWGESTAVSFTVRAAPEAISGTVVTNALYGATASNASQPAHGAPVTTLLWGDSHLRAVKAAQPTLVTADPGRSDVVTFTIDVSNLNDATAEANDVAITDTVPMGTELVSAGFSVGAGRVLSPSLSAGSVVTWMVDGRLARGAGLTANMVVHVLTPIDDGSVISNRAYVSAQRDYTETGTVAITVASAPDLHISKTASATSIVPGAYLTYTISYSNSGTMNAYHTVLTDTLPGSAYVNVVSTSPAAAQIGDQLVWDLGTLAGHNGTSPGTGSVTAVLTVTRPLTNGIVLLNTAAILSDEGGYAVTSDVTTAVSSSVDLALVKLPDDGRAASGEVITFTILYTNTANATSNAANLTITDQLPAYILGGAASTNPNLGTIAAGSTITWYVPGPLAPGEGGLITLLLTTAHVIPDGAILTNTSRIAGEDGIWAEDSAAYTMLTSMLDRFDIAPIGDQTAGIGFTVSITAVDQYGNRMADFDGPVQIRDVATPNTLQPAITGLFDRGLLVNQSVTITLARANRAIQVYTGTVTSVSQPFTVSVGAPGQLTVNARASTIRVGEEATVDVTVADAYGNPIPAEPLGFGVSPVGTAYPAAAVSSASGTATFAISSTIVGPATVVVTASNGLTGTAPVSFIAGFPAAVTVTVVPSSISVGSSAAITVEVRDAYGNGVNWDAVNLATLDPLGSGSIWPASNIALNLYGQGTSMISSTVPGPKMVWATAASNGRTGTGMVTYTVGAAQNIDLIMSPNPQQVGLSASLSATVRDEFGNPRAGDVITFSVLPGVLGGGGLVPLAGTTNAEGRVTASISSTVAINTPVTATLAGPEPVLSETEWASFVAGPPAAITLTVSPTEVQAGVSATLAATMTDRYGNGCEGQQATFTVSPDQYVLAGPATNTWIVPNPAAADSNGLVTATISSSLVGQVTITVQGPSAYTSTAVLTIIPGRLHHFVVTPVPDLIMAGELYSLDITAADENGLALTTATGWISITDQTGTILPTATWMVNGLASVDWMVTQPMANDWMALHWASDPAISATTNLFTVTAGLPHAVELDYALTMAACESQVITATVRDAHGNPVSGVGVQVLNLGVGVVAPAGVIQSDASGMVRTTFSSSQAGIAVVQFSANGVASVARFDVNAGAPTTVDLVALPALIRAGGTTALVATVTDCGGNGVPNQVISATIVSGYGTLSPLAGTTDSSGQVGFTLTATRIGTIQVMAFDAATGLQDTAMITVEPSCPQSVAMSANPQAIGANGRHSTIVATVLDTYGNPLVGRWVTFGTSGVAGMLNPTGGNTDAAGVVTTTLTSASQTGDISVAAIVSEAFCPVVSGTAVVHVGGSVVYLPVVLRQYSSLDLRLVSIQQISVTGGPDEVRVTIENAGKGAIPTPFWVDLYLDPSGPPSVNVLWNHICTYGKAWYVRQALLPGQQLVLSTNDPDDPSNPGDRYSNWPSQLEPGHTLYALVDSYGLPSIGAVVEASEANNILGPVMTTSASRSTGELLTSASPLSFRPVSGE